MPKLYANTVYMVLNSRIRIMGGRDIYTSDTDMIITTTMIKDMTSQSTEGTRLTDGIQERVSPVAITPEVYNDDHEMGRRKVSLGDSCNLLKLIVPQGETAGQQYNPLCIIVRRYIFWAQLCTGT